MGTPAVADVLKTGATLYYAPVNTAIPDDTTVDYGDAWTDWTRVGYTSEPLVMTYESEEVEIEVEEELSAVNRFRVSETLTLETKLAELTAAYLTLAGGNQDTVTTVGAGGAQKPYEYVGLGGKATLQQYAWGFEGFRMDDDGNAQPVRFFVWIGTAMIGGELEFSQKSDSYPGIPIKISAISDTSQNAGQEMLYFQRVTGPVTPGA